MGRPWWWKPNLAALVRMLESAGFEIAKRPRRLYIPPGAGQPTVRPSLRLLLSRAGREAMLVAVKGDPHVTLLARHRAPAG